MKQEGLLFFTDLYLMWIAFFLFFISFIGVVYKVFHLRDKSFYTRMANLPLTEDGAE